MLMWAINENHNKYRITISEYHMICDQHWNILRWYLFWSVTSSPWCVFGDTWYCNLWWSEFVITIFMIVFVFFIIALILISAIDICWNIILMNSRFCYVINDLTNQHQIWQPQKLKNSTEKFTCIWFAPTKQFMISLAISSTKPTSLRVRKASTPLQYTFGESLHVAPWKLKASLFLESAH